MSVGSELLEAVKLQWVRRVFTLERDDRAQGAKFLLRELLATLIASAKGLLQFTNASMAVGGTILDRPDAGGSATPTTEFLICGAVFNEEVAEVFMPFSQGLPPAVTQAPTRGHRL